MLTNNTQYAPGKFFFLTNPVPYLSIATSNSDVPPVQAGQVVLTNVGGNLYVNGSVVGTSSNWSLFPTISNTIYMDASNKITNVGSNLYFDGNLIANASDISNVGDWALYNSVADVKLSNAGSNYSITGAKNITAINNVSGGTGTFTSQVVTPVVISASNLSVSATSNLTQYCGTTLCNNAPTISNSFNNTYNIFGDKGSDYTDFCYTNISNKGGKGGSINFVADAGQVNIGGTDYGIGGQINLTANSPLIFPYNLTSAIKLSAASVLSYAGAVTPLGSLAGYNYIQGTLGVNIVAGSVSSIPNTAGTIYLYGANGTKLQNSLYVDAISNYPGSNLNIHPDSSQWTDMTRVQYIGMGNNPKIDGGGGTTSIISNFAGVIASNITGLSGGYFPAISGNSLTSINVPLTAGSDLTLTAQQFVGLTVTCNYNVNVNASSNINLNPSNGGVVSVNGDLNMSNHNVSNIADLKFNGTSARVGYGASQLYIQGGGIGVPVNITNAGAGISVNGNITLSAGTGYNTYFTSGALYLSTATPILMQGGNIDMGGGTICNVGNILGSNLTVSTGGNLTLTSSTGGQIVAGVDLNMSNHNVSNIGTYLRFNTGAYLDSYTPGGFTNAFLEINGTGGDSQLRINNGSANINLIANGDSYIIPATGHNIILNGPITANSNLNMTGATICNVGNILGSNLTVSTGGNLTLTSSTGGLITTSNTLQVTSNPILVRDTFAGIVWGYNAPYNVGIDGPYVFGYSAGALGTTGVSGTLVPDISLQWDRSNINAQKNLIMNGHDISNVGGFTRTLSATAIAQPVIQYGTATGSGSNGSVSVTIPTAYTSSSSYVVQVTMRDSPTAQLYATPTASNTFTIGWSSAGAGTQNIMWTTFGT